MQKRKIDDLREQLFDTIEMLKSGQMTIETAKVIAEVGQVVINSAKAEIDFIKVVSDPGHRKAAGTGFVNANIGMLELPSPEPAESK